MRTAFSALFALLFCSAILASEVRFGDLTVEIKDHWKLEKERKSRIYQTVYFTLTTSDGTELEFRHHDKRIKRKWKVKGHIFRPPLLEVVAESEIKVEDTEFRTLEYRDYGLEPNRFMVSWGGEKDILSIVGDSTKSEEILVIAYAMKNLSNQAAHTTPAIAPR
ncbi:hypothetical protein [Pelagicoccus mobilis]|uniref:DUF3108 domain-containing protein n=1 Tax=Pelagicoccus mobilis TaxID=415221 RepID=A0A934S3U9_9BACT|nr:hypothetical protein [Pelagicoccus mobilis]MBK1880695.1 hypothetical protein [Pelagicoccus mobilis]